MNRPDPARTKPANSTFQAERAGILEAFKCLVDGVDALYVGAPITGGRRFLSWYDARGRRLADTDPAYDEELRTAVIEPNCEAGRVLAGALRRQTQGIVIDPTRFFLDHWSQPHYHELWCEVIRRFATAVHFADGWWLSVGCAIEFATAIEHDVPTYEGRDSPLSAPRGRDLLQEGVRNIDRLGAPSDTLVRLAKRVEALAMQEKVK